MQPLGPLRALSVFQGALIADGSWSVLLTLSRPLLGVLGEKAERLRHTGFQVPLASTLRPGPDPTRGLSGYLVLRLLLSLVLVAVGLGFCQARPTHLLWLECTVRGTAL